MYRKRSTPRVLFVFLIALLATSVVYGFAAANTVPDSGAGDGAGTISGYTIENVVYTLNSTNPQLLDQVKFDISADESGVAVDVVKVRLDASTTTWYDCTVESGVATCDLTGTTLNVVDTDELRVVAVSDHTP